MKIFFLAILLTHSAGLQAQMKSPNQAASRLSTTNPINKYLNAVGLKGNELWNAAFVYWCYNYYPGGNPLPKTGSGMEMWNRLSAVYKLTAGQARKEPDQIIAGNIFFISETEKDARVGIVVSVSGDDIETVEADTYVILTRKIYSELVVRKKRKLSEIDLGFSNFSDAPKAMAN